MLHVGYVQVVCVLVCCAVLSSILDGNITVTVTTVNGYNK
jgi:hypothetical protein